MNNTVEKIKNDEETDIKSMNMCSIGILFGADERKRSCDKGGH